MMAAGGRVRRAATRTSRLSIGWLATLIAASTLVLGVKKSLSARPNRRSADFIAPSTANGCAINRELPDLDPQGRHPHRFSLMPDRDTRLLGVRTSSLVTAGYEVHLNLSPVVIRDGWERDWGDLPGRLDDELGNAFKAQAAAEVMMLAHNRDRHAERAVPRQRRVRESDITRAALWAPAPVFATRILGCLGSLVVSVILTLILLAVFHVL
jgi:hypothetical protein